MACEILFKTEHHAHAVNYTHPDPEKDRRGVYKKGYPVGMKQIPHPGWGTKEGLPYFAKIRVTDGDVADVESMVLANFSLSGLNQSWTRQIDWAVVNNDPVIDGWRLRVFSINPGFSNMAGITRVMVENYLNNWNAEVFSAATNEVVFDVAVYEDTLSNPGALQSEGFWGFSPASIVFNEISYVSGTGMHQVEADYSALQAVVDNPQRAEQVVADKGGSVVSNTANVITFNINRTDVLDVFKEDVREKIENVVYRRQLRIAESDIDSIVAAGGLSEMTLAELQLLIINRLDEDL